MIKHLQSGQPFRISSFDFNDIADSANAFKRRAGRSSSISEDWNPSLVLVRNDSSAARERGEILEVSSVAWTPSQNKDSFLSRPCFVGTSPTASSTRYAALVDSLPTSGIGLAVIDGLAIAKITGATDTTRKAKTSAGTHTLAADASGGIDVVWAKAGETYAIVRIGAVGTASLPVPTARYQVLQAVAYTNSTTYTLAFDFPVAHA